MGSSPLGQYAAPAAAIGSIGVIGAFVIAIVLQHLLGLSTIDLSPLHDLAFLAAGALFGSSVAVNGVKGQITNAARSAVSEVRPEIDAAHLRLDAIKAPSADASASMLRPRPPTSSRPQASNASLRRPV